MHPWLQDGRSAARYRRSRVHTAAIVEYTRRLQSHLMRRDWRADHEGAAKAGCDATSSPWFLFLLSISIATGLVLTSKDTKHVSGRQETGEQVAMLSSSLAFPVVDMSMRACMQASSSASKLLKETCSYIMSLPREVDDLSGRLSYLTLTLGPDSPQAEITRSILGS
ncbi:hypothetical protein BHE74_00026403 [Ensete ventricosum]|nr:hypothetical protein BHE74_00026403 [Ensete ventricosum]